MTGIAVRFLREPVDNGSFFGVNPATFRVFSKNRFLRKSSGKPAYRTGVPGQGPCHHAVSQAIKPAFPSSTSIIEKTDGDLPDQRTGRMLSFSKIIDGA